MNEWEKWPRGLRRVSAPVRPTGRPRSRRPVGDPGAGARRLFARRAPLVPRARLVGLLAAPLAFAAFPRLADRGVRLRPDARPRRRDVPHDARADASARPSQRPPRRPGLASRSSAVVSAGVFFAQPPRPRRAFLRENRRLLLQGEVVFAVGIPALSRNPRAEPRDLLGREADGLLDPEHPRADPLAPALGPVARRRAARLLHVRPGDGRRPDVPDEPLDPLHVQPGLRPARRHDPAGRLLAGAQLGRAPARGHRRRGADAASRKPLGPARVARQRSDALDWDYFWATSRVIRDTINEYPFWSLVFADLHAHVLAIPVFLLFAARGAPPRSRPRATRRLDRSPAARRGGAPRLRRRVPGADERLGRAAARRALVLVSADVSPSCRRGSRSPGPARAVAARSRRRRARPWLLALPLWFRAGGRPGVGKEPRGLLGRRRPAHGLRPLLLPRDRLVARVRRRAARRPGRRGGAPRWIAGPSCGGLRVSARCRCPPTCSASAGVPALRWWPTSPSPRRRGGPARVRRSSRTAFFLSSSRSASTSSTG